MGQKPINMGRIATRAILVGALFLPFTVLSQGLVVCNITECTFCDLFKLIQLVYNFVVFTLVPPLAVGLVAYAGFLWLVSAGSPGRAGQALKIMQGLVIGLVLVYTSWVIVNFVIVTLFNKTPEYDPVVWYKPLSWFTTLNCTNASPIS